MLQDKILPSLIAAQPRDYAPSFSVREPGHQGWRVADGDEAVAFLLPTAFDIWRFSPWEEPILANREPPGTLLDLHTVHRRKKTARNDVCG